jgi:hypothetical protein
MTVGLIIIAAAIIIGMLLGLPFLAFVLFGFGVVALAATGTAVLFVTVITIAFIVPDKPKRIIPEDDDLIFGDAPRIPPALNDHVWGA